MYTSGKARRRYEELQKEWQQAFSEFKAANTAFSAAVSSFHQGIEAEKAPAPSQNDSPSRRYRLDFAQSESPNSATHRNTDTARRYSS
jgi:hypothetical protein